MEILEERFRSRFEWGLIADITLPDYETRMAILHKKEEQEGYNINEEVIKYIATNIKSNIRELEGAFNKVMASSKLEKKKSLLNSPNRLLRISFRRISIRSLRPNISYLLWRNIIMYL